LASFRTSALGTGSDSPKAANQIVMDHDKVSMLIYVTVWKEQTVHPVGTLSDQGRGAARLKPAAWTALPAPAQPTPPRPPCPLIEVRPQTG
jgi:hypothetical protein